MHKKDLWLRLRNYHFDHIVSPGIWDKLTARFGHDNPSMKAFAGKIARKYGWSSRFALLALKEYRKFLYLGVVSDFIVTPSKIIDVVWHEHLLFSKAYREFCNEVLGQPFDHYPELVPMEEQTGHYSAQYLDTLELYQTEFGIEPPAVIWGSTKFDKEQLDPKGGYRSTKKQNNSDAGVMYSNEAPLHLYYSDAPATDYPEFSGYEGGDFGGGGSGGHFGDSGSGDSGGDGGGCSAGCGGGGD